MMLLPRGLAVGKVQLDSRQDSAPCPQGNGTTVGEDQEYTLLCSSIVEGDVMDRPDAFDFSACLDICSSFHPKCEAISFNENRCLLKNNIQLDNTRTARRIDSAVARFPGASSNCPTVGANQVVGSGANFGIMCGSIIAGFDMSQNFAPTFQDCMGQCAFTAGCAAISFDASQNQGFKNCYLKTTVTNSSAVFPDRGIDSAVIGSGGAADQGGGAAPVATTVAPGVTTIPLPQSTGGGAGGAVFFTPPGGSVAVPIPVSDVANTAVAPAATTPAAGDQPPLSETLIPSSISFTLGISPSESSALGGASPTPNSSLNNNTTTEDSGEGGSSNAWIAAPVVGSIAALVLIVLSFIMIRRRRRNGNEDSAASRNISRPSPVSSLFTTWLPSPGRITRSSRSSKMGNFSEVTGKQMSGGAGGTAGAGNGLRGSVVGFFRPGGSMNGMERLDDIEETGEKRNSNRESTPVYDLKEGKIELRNSLNGLGQNRWS